MKQIKGTMIVNVVRAIRADKSRRDEYYRHISDIGKDLLKQRILSSAWYPFEAYKECFDAMCLIVAKNNPKLLNEWGHNEADRWLTTVYKAVVTRGDPKLAAEKYSRFHKMVFNFGEYKPEFISDTEVDFTYIDIPRDWENFYHLAVGFGQRFIGLTINKKVNFRYLNKSWQGKGWTKVRLSWLP
ncbi:MAG: hypothetical protein ACFFA0_15090 [Promethearchaeota archaeon]